MPFICEFMPLRWSYESAILAQSELNPLTKNQNQLQKSIQEISKVEQLTPTQEKDLDAAKEALVIISRGAGGEHPADAGEIDRADQRLAEGEDVQPGPV
ncbi:MAG: hypothetical protein R3F11_11925 [Verrucomicrobiales bacterium]